MEPSAGDNFEHDDHRVHSSHLDSSPLENMPAELRNQILMSAPDLPTLQALVHASPVMHAQYMSNRDAILRACMERELDGLEVHAYACLMSRVRSIGKIRTDEAITRFVEKYVSWLPLGSSPVTDLDRVDPSSLRWMASFHLGVARPLARRYSTWALGNLVGAVADSSADHEEMGERPAGNGIQHIPLSRSEEIRIMRALYQCETYHHLFGRNKGKRRGAIIRWYEVNEMLFSLFDLWDVEAVGCIDLFVRQRYNVLFDEVQEDLRHTNPNLEQSNGSADPSKAIDLEEERSDYLEGSVSRGLQMTVRLLAIRDHDTLVSKMRRCLTRSHPLDVTISSCLYQMAQNDRRQLATNVRDEAEARRDLMEFTGDVVPPNGPPLGWVLLWGGVCSNLYGDYVPLTVRQWGYVMWDERRWVGLGAKELVAKQWETSPEIADEIEANYHWRPAGM